MRRFVMGRGAEDLQGRHVSHSSGIRALLPNLAALILLHRFAAGGGPRAAPSGNLSARPPGRKVLSG